jgi:hypothetical protein
LHAGLQHLLTLEPAISAAQTDEMQSRNLHLVLPSALHATYSGVQKAWLMDVSEFVEIVRERQISESD